MTGRRELDGVAHQSGQDLAQPPGVAIQPGRRDRIALDQQFQVGGRRLGAEQFDHIEGQVQRVEGNRLEAQLARLQLGQVEDVIEQGQQGLPATGDDVQMVPLLGIQPRP